jgi:hypothetical protein
LGECVVVGGRVVFFVVSTPLVVDLEGIVVEAEVDVGAGLVLIVVLSS